MIKKLLRLILDKSANDMEFVETPCYKAICEYLGEPVHNDLTINVYQYAKRAGREYSTCKKIAVLYDLGTLVNGKRLLSENEVAFMDETRRGK